MQPVSSELVDHTFKVSKIRTGELFLLLAVLEGYESRHNPDSDLLRYLRLVINVYLVEVDVGHPFGKSLENWRNHFARSTPGRPKVEDRGLFAVDNLLELGEGFDRFDNHCDK